MRTMKSIGCLAFVSMLSVCAIADQQAVETKGEKTWMGTLWNGNKGTLDDLKPGDKLTVTYQSPGGLPVACRIQGDSLTFVGTIEAVDLADHTVRAKEFLGKKNFHLGSGCRISDGTRDDLSLKDLALDGKYTFTYVDVDGVAVVDHIAPAPHSTAQNTASAR